MWSSPASKMSESAAEIPAAEVEKEAPAPAETSYRIELGFPPDQIPQWRALGTVTGTRRRPTPIRILWHDSPDGALARRHLSIEQQDDAWRLIVQSPGKHPFPPLSPPPVLAEAACCADLGINEQTAPIASFIGRSRTLMVAHGDEIVAVRWSQGAVSGVADQTPAARILLAGPRGALEAMALALADQGAFVPAASLAAEAIAVAGQNDPAPRHKGATHVPEGDPVADGLAFAIGQLVDATLYWAAVIPAASDSEPVHQMRVAVRRLRSLLGIPKRQQSGPRLLGLRDTLRDLARDLGDARGWDVFLEGVGAAIAAMRPADRRISALLNRARKHRDAAYGKLRADLEAPAMQRIAMELALFASLRLFAAEGDAALWETETRQFAVEALDRRAHQLFAPGDDISALTPHELHEVRKSAKRLRYACELFEDFWGGKAARKYLERLGDLQEALGEINDVAALEPQLSSLGTGFAAGFAIGVAAERARPAQQEVQAAWRKLASARKFWK